MTKMSTPDLTHDWVPRALDLPGLLAKRSHFLLGPRQTGKTSLVHRSLKDAKIYDLLDTSVYLALNQNPGRLAEELAPGDRIVVIDEIQRLPELLNEVHRLIETRGLRFLLTGSSARKSRWLRLRARATRRSSWIESAHRGIPCGMVNPKSFFHHETRRNDQRIFGRNSSSLADVSSRLSLSSTPSDI